MTRDHSERTETSTDRTDRGSTGLGRRSMLIALGAGSTVALGTQYGRVSGQEDDGDGDGEGTGTDGGSGSTAGEQCPPCVDRYSGYLWAASEKEDGGELDEISPALTVDMRVTDADVVFPEPGEGAQGNESVDNGTDTGTPMGGNATGTPGAETGTPTNETGTPEGDTGTPTGDGSTPGEPPMGGEGQGFPDFYFDPVGIALEPGEVVEFVTVEDIHTVTAYHPRFFDYQRRVPENVPGFSSPPVMSGDSWYYRFEVPGVYDLHCLPHEGLGMVMRVVVQAGDSEEAPEAYEDLPTEESGISPISQRVLNAPELDPENVLEQGTVAWTDLTEVASEPPLGP